MLNLWSISNIAAWVLTVLAAGLCAWALFADRSRGRRRCAKCWYSMAGVPGLRCPECGHAAKHERGLFKARKRWRWVGAALVLAMVAYGVFVTPRVRYSGWAGAVPTVALVLVAPIMRSEVGPDTGWMVKLRDECNVRFSSEDNHYGWQARLMVWRLRAACWIDGRWGVTAAERRAYERLRTNRMSAASRLTVSEVGKKLERDADVRVMINQELIEGADREARTLSVYDGMTAQAGMDSMMDFVTDSRPDGVRLVLRGNRFDIAPGSAFTTSEVRGVVYDVEDLEPVEGRWLWYEHQYHALFHEEFEPVSMKGLSEFITELVASDFMRWEAEGNRRVYEFNNELVVVAPALDQVLIGRILDAVRRLETGESWFVDIDDLGASRMAAARVRGPVGVGDEVVTSLGAAVSEIERRIGVPVRVDWSALGGGGIDERSRVVVPGDADSGEDLLTSLLSSITQPDAPVWALDGGSVVITTNDVKRRMARFALYDIRDVLRTMVSEYENADDRLDEIVELIEKRTGVPAWDDDRVETSMVEWGGRLLVKRTPRDHELIRELLEELRRSKKDPG